MKILPISCCMLLGVGRALAQGSLIPAGPPAPEMKSLQEIRNATTALDQQVASATTRINQIRQHNRVLANLVFSSTAHFAWNFVTADATMAYGESTSLAIGPDGHPAIAYRADGVLKFAHYDGSQWTTSTADAGGNTGWECSLKFGPDGYPAIAYYDLTNGNLKFARKGIFKPAP